MNLSRAFEQACRSAREFQLGTAPLPRYSHPAVPSWDKAGYLAIMPGSHFCWVRDEMTALLGRVACRVPDSPLTPEMAPAESGVVLFEQSHTEILPRSSNQRAPEVAIGGFGWFTGTDSDGTAWLCVPAYAWFNDLLYVVDMGFVPWGVSPLELAGQSYRSGVYEPFLPLLAFAFWNIARQIKDVEATHESPERATRRRLERDGFVVPEVLVVRLRRRAYEKADSLGAAVEWSRQWWVDPYWRRSATDGHLELVRGHRKGPPDKPFVAKQRLHALVR